MVGETSLIKLLASVKPTLKPETYVFTTISAGTNVSQPIIQSAVLTFRESEGLTLVLPEQTATWHNLPNTIYRSRQIVLDIHSSLDAVGFLAHITTKLAEKGISVNPVSAFYHDHLFVKVEDAEKVMEILNNIRKEAVVASRDGKQGA